MGIRTKLMIITPRRAETWLKKNAGNRPLSKGTAEVYAGRIRRGEWRVTTDTIKFDDKDNLIDGQHRLMGIILSGMPITCLVAFGVDADVFSVLDQGKRRTASDSFAISGEKGYAALAAAALIVHGFETGNMAGSGASPDQLLDVVERHPGLRESLAYCDHLRNNRRHLPVSVATAVHYLGGRAEGRKEMADKFFKELYEGEGLTRSSVTYKLRERLLANKASRSKLGKRALLHLVAKAWLRYARGENVGVLSIGAEESMPKIEEFQK